LDHSHTTPFSPVVTQKFVAHSLTQATTFLSPSTPRISEIFVYWTGVNDILFKTSITAAYFGFISIHVVGIGALFANTTANPTAYGIDQACT
jgi:hypothetical protein